MTLFVSYTRSDETLVRVLKKDLESLGRPVWLDHQIHGGEQWWQEIIQQIQNAEVFLFALSKDSWRSKPCRLELNYAEQLGVPIVPVQVGPVESLKISLAKKQLIDYRERTADVVVALATAVSEFSAETRELPDPLPDPPEMPFEYLFRLASLMEKEEISRKDQGTLIAELRQRLKTEDDDVARNDILMLLKELQVRDELTVSHAAEIDEILRGIQVNKVPPAEQGVTRLSPADHWRRAVVDPASGSAASAKTSRTIPPAGSGAQEGQGPASTGTSKPSAHTRPHAGASWRSGGHGEGSAPQQRVAPTWLTDLVQQGEPAGNRADAAADTKPHTWPRPSATPTRPPTRKWWLEERGSDEPSPVPTAETPTTSSAPPPAPEPPAAAPGMSRLVTVLVIVGLLVTIVLVVGLL